MSSPTIIPPPPTEPLLDGRMPLAVEYVRHSSTVMEELLAVNREILVELRRLRFGQELHNGKTVPDPGRKT
jgi:hypothetical protein